MAGSRRKFEENEGSKKNDQMNKSESVEERVKERNKEEHYNKCK